MGDWEFGISLVRKILLGKVPADLAFNKGVIKLCTYVELMAGGSNFDDQTRNSLSR